jgi:Fe-S-cluster containining protein
MNKGGVNALCRSTGDRTGEAAAETELPRAPSAKKGLKPFFLRCTMRAHTLEGRSAVPRKRTPAKKPSRTKKKTTDASICTTCIPARCCMYFSTEIDPPRGAKDFDDMLWMIAHRDVEIYTKRRRWYLMVKTPCRFYDPARGCLIYPSRPRICRAHHPSECEYHEDYEFDLHFHSYEELERHFRLRHPK